MRKVAYVIPALILSGCGGGGGNETPPPPVVLDPTLTFTASRDKILIDEGVTLSWSSTNTNSCVLTTTNDTTVSTKGSTTLTYQSAGDKQVKLSCSNATKSVSQNVTLSVNAPTTFSLDTNASAVTYYDSYIRPTKDSADLEQNKCNLDPVRVTYPKSYIGNRNLPSLSGFSLDPKIQRLITIKDAMGANNPAEIPGCTGDLKKELKETLQRIKNLGADWVALPQWQWASIRSDGSWYIMTTEESSNGGARLNDDEFAFAVNEAKKLGLKVLTWNQIQGVILPNSNGSGVQVENTFDNQKKFFAAFRAHMKKRAEFFQSLKVDAIELSCNGCIPQSHDTMGVKERDNFIREQYIGLISDTKSYTGLLFMSEQNWLKDTPEVYNRIDGVIVGFYIPNMTSSEEDTLTVEKLKSIMTASAKPLKERWANSGKYIYIATGAGSRRGIYVGNDGTHIDEICPADKSNCAVNKWETDFALQAIYHEAAFQTIREVNFGDKVFAGVSDMLVTDNLTPHMLYPNVMSSIRNKPSEGVIKHWFQR